MKREELIDLTRQLPKPLWQLKDYEISPEQRGERELAIREKAFELGDRSGSNEEALHQIAQYLGMYDTPSKEEEFHVVTDPETESTISLVLSKSDSGVFGVRYFESNAAGERRELPRTQDHYLPVFGVEGYSAQELDLRNGRVAWSHEERDIDIRPDILAVADSVVGHWEDTIELMRTALAARAGVES